MTTGPIPASSFRAARGLYGLPPAAPGPARLAPAAAAFGQDVVLLQSALLGPPAAPPPMPPARGSVSGPAVSSTVAPGAPPPAPPAVAPGAAAGQVQLDSVQGQYLKDPSFANGGNPVGDRRYIAFGDLHDLYLKAFDLAPTPGGAPGLRFDPGEVRVRIQGLAPGLDGKWAPQVAVAGDRVQLFYTAGRMDGGIAWNSFRLHGASMPLADFEAQAKTGTVTFQDQGPFFQDQTTFGDRGDFGMIDPMFYTNPQGQAYMLYTVVQPAERKFFGLFRKRPWQEFVRARQVDPNDPTRAIGPDTPLVDGWAGGRHDGVAEAPDAVTVNGKTVLFVSSKPGDKDQQVLAAATDGSFAGRVPDAALKPVLTPGEAPWEAKAVGSTSAMVLPDGQLALLYQGMDANHRFTLGWKTISMPG